MSIPALQYLMFRLFSACVVLRDYVAAGPLDRARMSSLGSAFPLNGEDLDDASGRRSIVIYAATIGELTGARSFISRMKQRFPQDRLVIVCGQDQYLTATSKLYPSAVVGVLPTAWTVGPFLRRAAPRVVCILEGPCLHGWFPIRMNLALPAACGARGIPMFVIQASPHGLTLGSTIERVEHSLFGNLHKRAVTNWYPPFPEFAEKLIALGAPADKVVLAGDMKFSNVFDASHDAPPADLARILSHYRQVSGPIIVGGSVNSADEVQSVLTGWKSVKRKFHDARFILAPRHVNRPEAMDPIYRLLEKEDHTFVRRTEITGGTVDADILVIDVFGELTHFYEIADLCYIGRNHGVIEPLRFRKPIVVAPDEAWDHGYVTYPQYKLMTQAGAICQTPSASRTGETFLRIIEDDGFRQNMIERAVRLCEEQLGSLDRVVEHVCERLRDSLPA